MEQLILTFGKNIRRMMVLICCYIGEIIFSKKNIDKLDLFKDILRCVFEIHGDSDPIPIKWRNYMKSCRNLREEQVNKILNIILDMDCSGHDCTLKYL